MAPYAPSLKVFSSQGEGWSGFITVKKAFFRFGEANLQQIPLSGVIITSQKQGLMGGWYRLPESNRRPLDPHSSALTN